ncbi:MAG: hypothetical protein OEV42_17110 [Deltaproteobacteria bacterium]|nr:hypothetical protein [Deltaproteobacteria bacterium]
MLYVYVLMIITGVIALAIGFWASYYAKKPWDIVGAVSLPFSLVFALLGILLVCVPNFFKG